MRCDNNRPQVPGLVVEVGFLQCTTLAIRLLRIQSVHFQLKVSLIG